MEFLGIVDSFNGSLLPGMVFSYAKEGDMLRYLRTDAGRALSIKDKLKLVSHIHLCELGVLDSSRFSQMTHVIKAIAHRQFCTSILLLRRLTCVHIVHSLKMIHRDIKAVYLVKLLPIYL